MANETVLWDMYEAAILLDLLLHSKSRHTAILACAKEASTLLRTMAVNRGYDINSGFRSVKGILDRIRSMESALAGKTVGRIPASALFREIVRLYRDDRPQYDKILREAKTLIASGNQADIPASTENDSRKEGDCVKRYEQKSSIPPNLRFTILENYSNGLRLEATSLRLLEAAASCSIDEPLQNELQNAMFRRSDGLYFFPDSIIDMESKETILQETADFLSRFGCFDIAVEYRRCYERFPLRGLRDENDFADFLLFLNPCAFRVARFCQKNVARKMGVSKKELAERLTNLLRDTILESGYITESELLDAYPAFDSDFFRKLIEKYSDEILYAEIADAPCYQIIQDAGLDEEFSALLDDVLNDADRLSLEATPDVLNALLSVRMGANFRTEYNIPDDKTFRRVIAMRYTGDARRAWKSGKFTEVDA